MTPITTQEQYSRAAAMLALFWSGVAKGNIIPSFRLIQTVGQVALALADARHLATGTDNVVLFRRRS